MRALYRSITPLWVFLDGLAGGSQENQSNPFYRRIGLSACLGDPADHVDRNELVVADGARHDPPGRILIRAMQLAAVGLCWLIAIAACGQNSDLAADDVAQRAAVASTPGETDASASRGPNPEPTATYPADMLAGITIALDAGHGDGDEGAMGYCLDIEVLEVDVNLRTRELLQAHLESVGATVYLVPQQPEREGRVLAAESAGADILLSIHHNGFEDADENYTMTFVSDETDLPLAFALHPRLVEALALPDSGIQFEEFGITHFGTIPAVLTEAAFITNSVEACNFLGNQSRVRAEALALFHGLAAYFAAA